MKFTVRFSFLNRVLFFSFYVFKKPQTPTVGMQSRCADSRHVLFLDYDCITYDALIEELKYIQEIFQLSEFYIFKSSPKREDKYHAICLDKASFKEIWDIINETSCDYAFKKAPGIQQIRSWVLRFAPKKSREAPQFIQVLKSKYHIREQSAAHAKFLEVYYKVPVVLCNSDAENEMKVVSYLTSKV